jgi:hypothetical protein
MGGPFQEMGAKAAASKPKVDPWSRHSSNRFSGPGSINEKVYEAERSSKSPAPRALPSPNGSAARHPLGDYSQSKRAASAPCRRPTPARKRVEANPAMKHSSPKAAAGSPTSGMESRMRLGSSKPSNTKGSSSFVNAAKGRFDSGPGSMYASASGAPGPGTFNPDDLQGGALGKSVGASARRPSAGMTPTAKGRFDSGPGSMYRPASPRRTQAKKKKPEPSQADAAAEEWSKKLGLGAVAGAKAAPVLKAVDEARAAAEAKAEEAIAAMEAAEERAAAAIHKAEWMTNEA